MAMVPGQEIKTMATDFGSVEFGGKTYRLTDDIYCSNYGTDGGVRYYAYAIDEAGNKYRVAWDTTAEWDARDPEDYGDDSEACDWSAPVDVVLTETADDEP